MNFLENKTVYPDGYYVLSGSRDPQKSLVYLYSPNGVNGVRYIAFQIMDGSALMPVWDVSDDSIMRPVQISLSTTPMKNEDIDQL